MNRHMLIGLAVGLLVGIFIGYQAGSTTAPSPAEGAMPGGSVQTPAARAGDNFQAQITTLQQIVARDPKNGKAWEQLGNDYFDTRQPQKAVEAYDHALELDPKNPDVLTDQGTMYRALGQFDKALANFEKANKIDPKHMQSLYNIGVVYSNDLKEPQKAVAAWNKILEIAPQSAQAAEARTALEQMKKQK